MISFTVYGQAQPAGSKRAFVVKGKARVTDANKNSAPWKQEVASKGAEAMDGLIPTPLLEGALEVWFTVYVPRPAGHYGRKANLLPSARPFPTVKPDLLKLARGLEDALTGIVWRDDAQIISESLLKLYGAPARVVVAVREIAADETLTIGHPAIHTSPTERITP